MLSAAELLPTISEVRDQAYQVVEATLVFDARQVATTLATNVGSEVVLYRFRPKWSMDYVMKAAATRDSSMDPVVAVYGPDGTMIAKHDDASDSDTSSLLRLPLVAGTSYTLAVTSYDIDGVGDHRITVTSGIVDDRFENNDTLRTATRVRQLAGGRFDGVMADVHDFYRLDLTGVPASGSSMTVDFVHADGDIDVALRDASGKVLTASDGATDQETLLLGGLRPGTYYVDVYGYGEGYNPAYTLRSDVTLGTGRAVRIANDRFEPNNTKAAAKDLGTVRATSAVSSLTLTARDVDFFKFSLATAGTAASDVLVTFDGALGDVDVDLLDSTGKTLGTSAGVASTERISLSGRAAGTYYLKVYGYDGVSNPSYAIRFNHGAVLAQPVELPFNGPITPPPPPAPVDPTGSWTIAVYMTSTDLATFGFDDVNEMEYAVSQFKPGAKIALFWDQWTSKPYATGNGTQAAWGSAGRAVVAADTNLTKVATSFEIFPMDRNTGDPAVLKDFLTWTMSVAPATNYSVVLWNHGGGLSGVNFDDESGYDSLTVKEIQQAVTQSGMKPGVLAYDACLMGNVEQFYELRALAPYQVASEELISGPGYDYRKAFSPLQTGTPSGVTPEALARGIVDAFTVSYVGDGVSTLAAIKSDAMTAVASTVKTFARLAAAFTPAQAARLVTIAKAVTRFDFKQYVDMKQFMTKIAADTTLPAAARTAATAVVAALNSAVIGRMADARKTGGMSIYVPVTAAEEIPQAGLFTDWAAATGWSGVVNRMLGRTAASRAGIGIGIWSSYAARRR